MSEEATRKLTLDLAGKTAVVTGSTQGIGLAIARRLAEGSPHVDGSRRKLTEPHRDEE